MLKKTIILLAITTQAFATVQGSKGSAASADLSSQGLGQIINGSGQLLQAGSQLTIIAIKTVGESTFITLKAVGNSATVTIRVGSQVSGHLLHGAGQMIQAVATASGVILTSAGKVVAFLPNEMGKSLLYSKV